MASLDVVGTGKGVVKESLNDDVTGLAAELSYRFFLAVFPFAIMAAALSGFIADAIGVENPTERIMNSLSNTLPEDTTSVLERQIESVLNSRDIGLLSFGLLGALWAASSGMGSIIKALNRCYDVPETRPWWRKTLLAVGLTLSAGLAVILAFIVMILAGTWGQQVAEWFNAGSQFELTVSLLRWPIALVLLMTGVAFIYWAAPNIEQKFRWVSPGAVLFTVVWLIATWAFGYYVSNFGSYNATYGALGGIVILLVWFYLTAAVLLVGAELNALIDSQVDPEAVEDRRQKVRAQRKDGPTAHEQLEQQSHDGVGRTRVAGRSRSESTGEGDEVKRDRGGGGFPTPAMAIVGLLAAMFAIRRLAR